MWIIVFFVDLFIYAFVVIIYFKIKRLIFPIKFLLQCRATDMINYLNFKSILFFDFCILIVFSYVLKSESTVLYNVI